MGIENLARIFAKADETLEGSRRQAVRLDEKLQAVLKGLAADIIADLQYIKAGADKLKSAAWNPLKRMDYSLYYNPGHSHATEEGGGYEHTVTLGHENAFAISLCFRDTGTMEISQKQGVGQKMEVTYPQGPIDSAAAYEKIAGFIAQVFPDDNVRREIKQAALKAAGADRPPPSEHLPGYYPKG